MKILEQIPSMDMQQLTRLEENCHNIINNGPQSKHAEAEKVILEVNAERSRRTQEEKERIVAARKAIEFEMRDRSLFERVVLAFEELPPSDGESKWLNVLATNPGADFRQLAAEAGSTSAGATNLHIGKLCARREHFLGIAPPSENRKGEKIYSALLVNFKRHKNESGQEWHSWRLKPEAEAALRHLGIINPK